MPYLGNDLQVAQPSYRNIDDISGSFNSSTTSFPLLVSGSAPVPFPINSNQCLISVAGVVQRPDDSGTEGFRISGGNIIFSSAPSTGADFFGVILAGADYVNVGANFPSGSAAAPSITFDSDLDTGIYNSAANQVSVSTAGSERLRIDSAGQVEVVSLGTASAPAFSFTSDSNTGIYSPGADQVAISTNGVQRVTVDSTGRVGIGAASPSSPLHVVGNSAGDFLKGGIRINDTNNSSDYFIGGSSSGGFQIATAPAGATRFVIDSSGRVGIGTTTPRALLDVGGSTAFNAGTYQAPKFAVSNGYISIKSDPADGVSRLTLIGDSTTGDATIDWGGNANANLIFSNNGSNRARIDSSGRLLVGTTSGSSTAQTGCLQVGDGWSYRTHYFTSGGSKTVTVAASFNYFIEITGTVTANQLGIAQSKFIAGRRDYAGSNHSSATVNIVGTASLPSVSTSDSGDTRTYTVTFNFSGDLANKHFLLEIKTLACSSLSIA